MADVIVYPSHGLPHKYVETDGYYAPQVTTTFDADGPIIHNRLGLAERISDNGDGTYSPIVTTATDPSDRLVMVNGLQQRYADKGDGTFTRVIATATLSGTDVSVLNEWGLLEWYVDLGDGTYALLANGTELDAAVYAFGIGIGYDETLGVFSQIWNSITGIGLSDSDLSPTQVPENAIVGATVGLTARYLVDNEVTYSITAQSTPGAFQINATTGVVTVATEGLLDYEERPTETVTVRATDTVTDEYVEVEFTITVTKFSHVSFTSGFSIGFK